MKIRPACPADAPMLARFITTAMSPECCAYFYGSHTAGEFEDCIAGLCKRDDTQYSYLNALVAEENGKVIGAAVAYDGGRLHQLRKPFIDAVKQKFGQDFSNMPDETGAGELYLDSFAVLPAFRRRGIGAALLQATAQRAQSLNLPLGLLVDVGNPGARRLYIRQGFQHVGTAKWGGHDMEHLQRSLQTV